MQHSPILTRMTIVLGLCLVFSMVLPWLSPNDPLAINLADKLRPPSLEHFFGTDDLGRDMLSRLLHGSSTTLFVSTLALLASGAIGIAVGAMAGYNYKRWPDHLFNWITSYFASLPALLVIAAVLGALTPSLGKAYLVLTLIIWVAPARIMRAEVIRVAALGYVMASRAIGLSNWRIVTRTIMPNCIETALIFSFGYFPEIIALEAGISFLGLGVQPPQPSLGRMIFDGIGQLYSAWWMTFFPAAFLTAVILIARLAANVESRAGRRA